MSGIIAFEPPVFRARVGTPEEARPDLAAGEPAFVRSVELGD